MNSSWKTTVAGLLATVGTGMSASNDSTTHGIGVVLTGVSLLLMGLSARDNDKTSEEVGAKAAADSRAYDALLNK